jgi:hypothetical protein
LKACFQKFAAVNSAIAVVKQKMTDSRRQFFAAVKKSEFQGLL